MTEIWKMSACAQAAAIASGEISASEATEEALAQVDAKNPHLNAIVDQMGDEARKRAQALDETFARTGPVGPLHGVTVTIKENVDQKGRATPNGVGAPW